jgi:alcohol dehydrogenase YqhD (iron-dependent ADH family)
MRDRIAALGTELFREKLDADATILRLEGFFRQISCPVRLADISIGPDQREALVNGFITNEVNGGNMKMTEEDYPKLVELMY